MNRKTLVDLVERAGATFAQAFLAIEVADQANIAQVGALKTAAYAGAFAVAKYALVKANSFIGANPTQPPPAA
jgi:hypothetical protein